MTSLAIIQTINRFAKGDMVTAIGLSVLVLAIGAGITAKMDNKIGIGLMLAGLVFGLYVLKVNGIFNL
ncbi:hypothetical protein GC173_12100 [bacterium]|nr:hypothetical protein [bacterium]